MNKLENTIKKIIKIKKIELDSNGRIYKKISTTLKEKQIQLQELNLYIEEYMQASTYSSEETIHTSMLAKQREFIAHLQKIIITQRSICTELESQTELTRSKLVKIYQTINEYEKLLKMLRDNKLKANLKLEQKFCDEIAKNKQISR